MTLEKTMIYSQQAPAAIGPYSHAVRAGDTVYLSGQIALDPKTMQLVAGMETEQAQQVLDNLSAVAVSAGGSLAEVVKLTIYLTDLSAFSQVNEVMVRYFSQPYPARVTVGVSALPRGALVEMDAIMVL